MTLARIYRHHPLLPRYEIRAITLPDVGRSNSDLLSFSSDDCPGHYFKTFLQQQLMLSKHKTEFANTMISCKRIVGNHFTVR
jgi:hypothetical protein